MMEVLGEVEDPRQRRGQRHPLRPILALWVAATLCGAKGYDAIAQGGRNYGAELARAVGFTRQKSPCAATFFHVFRRLERPAFEAQLSAWAEGGLATFPPREGEPEALAIDAKTLRGAQQQGALEVHLLSVLSHRLGLTLFQPALPSHTNEIGAIQQVLAALVLEGRGVTLDAMLCQPEIAQTIVDRGGTP